MSWGVIKLGYGICLMLQIIFGSVTCNLDTFTWSSYKNAVFHQTILGITFTHPFKCNRYLWEIPHMSHDFCNCITFMDKWPSYLYYRQMTTVIILHIQMSLFLKENKLFQDYTINMIYRHHIELVYFEFFRGSKVWGLQQTTILMLKLWIYTY